MLDCLTSRTGIDRAAIFAAATRAWSLLGGIVTVLLIATRFSPIEQGYYYTFLSLVGIQLLFELGLGQVMIQFTSHEWSLLALDQHGVPFGDTEALSRLASLTRLSTRWFTAAALLFFVALVLAGNVAFGASHSYIGWRGPWIALALGVTLDLCVLPAWSLVEGCNQVRSVYGLRFLRGAVSTVALWVCIGLGAGVWSLPVSFWIAMLVVLFVGSRRHRRLVLALLRAETSSTVDWVREVWPMQWRIAVSWLSGYLSFFLFTPVLFRSHGPVVAGEMGITWSAISAVSGVSGAFVQVRAPQLGIFIAQRRWRELDRATIRSGAIAMFVMLTGAFTLVAVLLLLPRVGLGPFSSRFLDPFTTSVLLVGAIASLATTPLSIYLRAHKREPLMWLSLTNGVLIAGGVVVAGGAWGPPGIAWTYMIVSCLVALPGVILIFFRRRKAWHQASEARVLVTDS